MKTEHKRDEAIEEIRTIRHQISAEFGHSTEALIKHYQELESQYADRLITSRKQTTQQTEYKPR